MGLTPNEAARRATHAAQRQLGVARPCGPTRWVALGVRGQISLPLALKQTVQGSVRDFVANDPALSKIAFLPETKAFQRSG